MHPAAFAFVERTVSRQGWADTPLVAIELGACNVNGSVRALFHPNTTWTGVDVRPGQGVDVVCAAEDYRPAAMVDVVVCTEVLEHAPEWRAILASAAGMILPGGRFVLTAAGPGRAPHGCDGGAVGDEHYENIDPDELLDALTIAGFASSIVETNAEAGDVYAVAWVAVLP